MPSRNVLVAFGLALILGIALGGSVVDWSWQWAYEQAANQQTNQHGTDIKQPSTVWHWATHDAVAVFTLFLCVVTGALAYVTYGLYRATAQLAADGKAASAAALKASTEATNLARDEFNATHRPEIAVYNFEASRDIDTDDREGVELVLRWSTSD